MVDKSGSNS